MGCRLGRVKLVEENINQANKRMEQIEKIFEVLTNDSRLKDIINQIEKNHYDSNNVLQQQEDEHKPDTCEN